jgi:hypothetical protein
MSLNLTIRQMPLAVTPTHSDHTWNVVMGDYSAYTDIRLVVDIYSNPYLNDSGSTQTSGKVARLLVPPNQFGNCIFNVETIIYNLVEANPRNLNMNPGPTSGTATTNPYNVLVANSQTTEVTLNTSQATINNDRISTIAFSNGFNGGYEGFENIYHINEYRCIFGVQYTTTGTSATCASAQSQTVIIIPTNYSAYTSYTGGTLSLTDASNQPYGVMVYPGVQENKFLSNKYYYSGDNLNGQYNYLNTQVYSYQMSSSQNGQFMATFGPETIPMTIFNSQVYQTRFRTHYYKCPIVLPFMYGKNPMFDNSSVVKGVNYLQKSQGNGQYNYDTVQTQTIDFTSRGSLNSYLQQRIAYSVFKQNPVIRTDSDVAIFLTDNCNSIDYDTNGVSEIVQYKMVGEECFNDPVSFLFLNRQGVWDTYTFTKKFTKRYNVNKKTYSSQKSLNVQWWNRQSYDQGEQTFYGDAEELVTVDSGFVQQNDVQIIEQLLMSPYVYMMMNNWLPEGNESFIYPYLIPCTVQNKDVREYIQKYVRIFQYTIELKQVPYRDYILPF